MKIFFLFSFAEKEKKYIFATELLLLTIHKQSSSKKNNDEHTCKNVL